MTANGRWDLIRRLKFKQLWTAKISQAYDSIIITKEFLKSLPKCKWQSIETSFDLQLQIFCCNNDPM